MAELNVNDNAQPAAVLPLRKFTFGEAQYIVRKYEFMTLLAETYPNKLKKGWKSARKDLMEFYDYQQIKDEAVLEGLFNEFRVLKDNHDPTKTLEDEINTLLAKWLEDIHEPTPREDVMAVCERMDSLKRILTDLTQRHGVFA